MSEQKPPTPGRAIFNMLVSMNQAQARVYRSIDNMTVTQRMARANRAARIAEARHRPMVLQSIKRISVDSCG